MGGQGENSHKILGFSRNFADRHLFRLWPPIAGMNGALSMPAGSAIPGIEPAHLQFIQREFQEVLRDRYDPNLIREIHRALFIEGKPLAALRSQLFGRRTALRVIAVTSGKGGVGKTTVSVNLAVALAGLGRRVLLFDADLGMANAHIFAGVAPRGTLLDVVEGRAGLAQILTSGPGGIQVVCGASGVASLADLDERIISHLGRELLGLGGNFDVLVIDTGAGISAQVMQFLALAHEMVVVTTPNLAAILDAYGVIKVTREARLPAGVSILVNQARDEAEGSATFDRIRTCAQRFLGFLPASLGFLSRDGAVEIANQSRQPLVLAQPAGATARRFRDLAAALAPQNAADVAESASHSFAA
jgi:flagellar biosynthesis protein FlhG